MHSKSLNIWGMNLISKILNFTVSYSYFNRAEDAPFSLIKKKPSCMLKLKPVQPRKRKRISSKDVFQVISSMVSPNKLK